MSSDPWRFQRWAFTVTTGSTARKSLLMMLAMMADATSGRCEAKLTTLAQGIEVSERAVRGHLKALEDAGLIARRAQFRVDHGQRGNEYLLLADGITEWPDGSSVPGGAEATCRGGRKQASGQELPLKNDHASKQEPRARAGKVELPEGFPEELREHAGRVYAVLRDLARRHGKKAPAPLALANVVMTRQFKPLVRSVYDYVAWAEGKARFPHKDVVAGYRNWLDGVDDLAAFESLDAQGVPVAPRANHGRNGASPHPDLDAKRMASLERLAELRGVQLPG